MGPLILIAALLAVDAPQFQVQSIDGRTVAGALVRLDAQEVVIKAADGERTFKLSDVRLIDPTDSSAKSASATAKPDSGATKPAEPPVTVETLDGTRLFGFEFEAAKGVARLRLASGETVGIPTKFIHRVDFLLGSKPAAWPELPKDAAADLIVVQKKDAVDLVEGVIGDVTADSVKFSVEGDVVPVKRAKVVGLVYFHSSQAESLPAVAAIVENKTGSKLSASSVTLANGELAITTTFGATIDWPLASVRSIDYSSSRLTYLSDLPPDSSEWTPLLDFGKQSEAISQFYKPRFDRALDGGGLSIGTTTFRKGVAMAARTVLEYKIAGRGRRFRATAGIDDSVHGAGSVLLTIAGDGKTLYSGKITGRGTAVELNLDVSSVKRLRIVADFGGGADVGDYLDLGDARIVK